MEQTVSAKALRQKPAGLSFGGAVRRPWDWNGTGVRAGQEVRTGPGCASRFGPCRDFVLDSGGNGPLEGFEQKECLDLTEGVTWSLLPLCRDWITGGRAGESETS